MAVKDLRVSFENELTQINIVGRREILSKTVEGSWATTFKGSGLEFTGYRPYTYSDDASMIDWKASLRSKDVLVREFEEYKNFNVVFCLDVSNSMLFTSGELFKAEYGAQLVHSLSQSAFLAGDAIGLFMFSDKVQVSLRPSYGSGMRGRFERFLKDNKMYGGKRDFKRSLLEINSMLADSAIIIIVSDFFGEPGEWKKYLGILGMNHQVIGLMIKDKRDMTLPKSSGQFVVKDPNGVGSLYIDTRDYAKEYEALGKNHVNMMRKIFKRLKSDCVLIENESDAYEAIKKFFSSQARVVQ
jgi:uncharacterized protein (DUF58 family)